MIFDKHKHLVARLMIIRNDIWISDHLSAYPDNRETGFEYKLINIPAADTPVISDRLISYMSHWKTQLVKIFCGFDRCVFAD